MKLLFVLLFSSAVSYAQQTETQIITASRNFQQELNKEYKAKDTSPLPPDKLKKFKGHDFFPIDARYAVMAHLTFVADPVFAPMPATGSIVNDYRPYALATFELDGKKYQLTLYQSKSLMNNPKYLDYFFLPFTDMTTGKETYDGGRYLEVRLPNDIDTVLLNFNMAYNPYCAYNSRFSCPIVPANNNLSVEIRAGVRGKK